MGQGFIFFLFILYHIALSKKYEGKSNSRVGGNWICKMKCCFLSTITFPLICYGETKVLKVRYALIKVYLVNTWKNNLKVVNIVHLARSNISWFWILIWFCLSFCGKVHSYLKLCIVRSLLYKSTQLKSTERFCRLLQCTVLNMNGL